MAASLSSLAFIPPGSPLDSPTFARVPVMASPRNRYSIPGSGSVSSLTRLQVTPVKTPTKPASTTSSLVTPTRAPTVVYESNEVDYSNPLSSPPPLEIPSPFPLFAPATIVDLTAMMDGPSSFPPPSFNTLENRSTNSVITMTVIDMENDDNNNNNHYQVPVQNENTAFFTTPISNRQDTVNHGVTGERWRCPSCTLENNPRSRRCAICQRSKGYTPSPASSANGDQHQHQKKKRKRIEHVMSAAKEKKDKREKAKEKEQLKEKKKKEKVQNEKQEKGKETKKGRKKKIDKGREEKTEQKKEKEKEKKKKKETEEEKEGDKDKEKEKVKKRKEKLSLKMNEIENQNKNGSGKEKETKKKKEKKEKKEKNEGEKEKSEKEKKSEKSEKSEKEKEKEKKRKKREKKDDEDYPIVVVHEDDGEVDSTNKNNNQNLGSEKKSYNSKVQEKKKKPMKNSEEMDGIKQKRKYKKRDKTAKTALNDGEKKKRKKIQLESPSLSPRSQSPSPSPSPPSLPPPPRPPQTLEELYQGLGAVPPCLQYGDELYTACEAIKAAKMMRAVAGGNGIDPANGYYIDTATLRANSGGSGKKKQKRRIGGKTVEEINEEKKAGKEEKEIILPDFKNRGVVTVQDLDHISRLIEGTCPLDPDFKRKMKDRYKLKQNQLPFHDPALTLSSPPSSPSAVSSSTTTALSTAVASGIFSGDLADGVWAGSQDLFYLPDRFPSLRTVTEVATDPGMHGDDREDLMGNQNQRRAELQRMMNLIKLSSCHIDDSFRREVEWVHDDHRFYARPPDTRHSKLRNIMARSIDEEEYNPQDDDRNGRRKGGRRSSSSYDPYLSSLTVVAANKHVGVHTNVPAHVQFQAGMVDRSAAMLEQLVAGGPLPQEPEPDDNEADVCLRL